MAASRHRPSIDRLTLVQVVRGIFARAPIFSDAVISEPLMGAGGAVSVDVGFGDSPPAFRVVAPSEDEAYAILHELAVAMVEIDRSHRVAGGNEGAGKHGRQSPLPS